MASRDEIIRFVYEVTGSEDIAAAAKAMLDAGKSGGAASEEVKRLSDELARLAGAADAIKAFTGSKAALEETRARLADAQAGLAALNQEFRASDASSRSVVRQFAAAEKAIADLSAEERKQQVEFAKAQGALQKAGIDTAHLGSAYDSVKASTAGVVEQIKATSGAAEQSGRSLRDSAAGAKTLGDESHRSTGLLGELRDNLGKIVAAAAAAATAIKGIEFAKQGFSEAADLEKSLSRVRALAQDAAQDLARYETAARAAGNAAGVSANAAAAAMAALVQSGRSANDAMAALLPTLRLAKIAQIDVAQAATQVDAALSQFGLGAENAGQVVDVLVAASKGAQDGLAGLTGAIGTVAPLARDLNLTFEDTAGVLGFLTRHGLDAGQATKGLQQIFRDLADPASKLSQNLFGLGDSSKDFASALRTLESSGEAGRRALDGLDAGARKVLLFLLQQGSPALEQFRAGLAAAGGEAERTAASLDHNLSGAWEGVTRRIDDLATQLAQPVLEPLRKEFVALSGRLDAFAKSRAFEEIKRAIGSLAEEGAKAIEAFLNGVDWSRFVDDAQSAISDAAQSFAGFRNDISGFARTVGTLGVSIATLFRAVETGIYAAATALAKAIEITGKGAAVLSGNLDVLLDSNNQAARILDSFGASATANYEKTGAAAAKLVANIEELTQRFDESAAAAGSAGHAVQRAGTAADQAASAVQGVGAAAQAATAGLQQLGEKSKSALDAQAEASRRAADAVRQHADALAAAEQRVRETWQALEQLTRSGEQNSDVLQRAQAAYQSATAALARLREGSQSAADAAHALREAMAVLGTTSQRDLAQGARAAAVALDTVYAAFQAGQATLEDVRRAFEAYAQRQREAVKDAEDWKKAQVEAALAVKAAMLGVQDAAAGLDPPAHAAESFRQIASGAQQAGQAVVAAGREGKAAQEGLNEAAGQGSNVFRALVSAYAAWTSEFSKTSGAAAEHFQNLTRKIFEMRGALSAAAVADSTNMTAFSEAMKQASQRVQKEIDEQKASVAALAAQYRDLDANAASALMRQQGGAERAAASFASMAEYLRSANAQMGLLGQADLSGLAAAADAAAAKVRAIADAAKAAQEQLQGMADSLRDQIDQINGDQEAIENRRYLNQLEQLRKLAEQGGTDAQAAYNDAVARANQLHNLKLRQLAEEQQRRQAAEGTSAPAPAPRPTSGPPGSSGLQPATPNITVNFGDYFGDSKTLLDELSRKLIPLMNRYSARAA